MTVVASRRAISPLAPILGSWRAVGTERKLKGAVLLVVASLTAHVCFTVGRHIEELLANRLRPAPPFTWIPSSSPWYRISRQSSTFLQRAAKHWSCLCSQRPLASRSSRFGCGLAIGSFSVTVAT